MANVKMYREIVISAGNTALHSGTVNVQGGHDNCKVGNAFESAVKAYVLGSRGRARVGRGRQTDMIASGNAYEIMLNGSGVCMIDENGKRYGGKLTAKFFIYAVALPNMADSVQYYVENAHVLTADEFFAFGDEWGLFRTKDHGKRITMQSPDPRSARKWGKVMEALNEYPTLADWFEI